MSTTRADIIDRAKAYAQESQGLPLLTGSGDYERAVDAALVIFDRDRANERVVHHTLTTSAYRFILTGAGALAGLTGLNAWVPGRSAMRAVYSSYQTTRADNPALDPNEWRVIKEPGLTVLVLAEATASSGTLRLEFTAPHTVHADTAANTSIEAGDVTAFAVLTAAMVLQAWATRAAQNTGSSALPGDVVDRRAQSDIARSRAKELLDLYRSMVGGASDQPARSASAVADLDLTSLHGRGFIFHTPRTR